MGGGCATPPPGARAVIRPGRNEDEAAYIRLIGEAWAEHPGCVFDVDAELPELHALAAWFAGLGGVLWVAEEAGAILGMVGVVPDEGGAWEIRKMYVDRAARGTGLAQRLLAAAEAHAAARGAGELFLWTDTRFTRAHRFYEARSFVRDGPLRTLADLSNTIEYRYAKPLGRCAVRALDAAGAASAVRRLSELLVACVADGAAVGFLRAPTRERAAAFWQDTASRVADGRAALFAGWSEGVLAGTVTLTLDMPENQPHRAGIATMLVHPAFRRRGLGRALLRAAEEAARAAGRRLLVLDTREGDPSEALYRAAGWTAAGRIADYALSTDGTPHATVIYVRSLA
jgi:GNAT superfamily N-acetyltransferase